jgi:bacterioferritin
MSIVLDDGIYPVCPSALGDLRGEPGHGGNAGKEGTMDKTKLIEGLNRDLADELGTVCRYIEQAAMAKGFAGHEVREFVKAEIADEVKHALFLAEKVAALGGTPIGKPSPYQVRTDPTAMLEHDLELERQAIQNYAERIAQAEAAGEIGLKVRLEEFIADETDHAEEIVRLLGR